MAYDNLSDEVYMIHGIGDFDINFKRMGYSNLPLNEIISSNNNIYGLLREFYDTVYIDDNGINFNINDMIKNITNTLKKLPETTQKRVLSFIKEATSKINELNKHLNSARKEKSSADSSLNKLNGSIKRSLSIYQGSSGLSNVNTGLRVRMSPEERVYFDKRYTRHVGIYNTIYKSNREKTNELNRAIQNANQFKDMVAHRLNDISKTVKKQTGIGIEPITIGLLIVGIIALVAYFKKSNETTKKEDIETEKTNEELDEWLKKHESIKVGGYDPSTMPSTEYIRDPDSGEVLGWRHMDILTFKTEDSGKVYSMMHESEKVSREKSESIPQPSVFENLAKYGVIGVLGLAGAGIVYIIVKDKKRDTYR